MHKSYLPLKKCSWDKTGEGNVVLDDAVSAQKYPKIVMQEKEKNQGIRESVFQKFFFYLTEVGRNFSHVWVHISDLLAKQKM